MATIELTATHSFAGRHAREVYAHMDIDENTTQKDIHRFVTELIGHTSRNYVKLEFRADDDFSDVLGVPVRIPTEKDSDNIDEPIFTVMGKDEIKELHNIVLDDIIQSIESVAYENQYEGAEEAARAFFELRDNILEE